MKVAFFPGIFRRPGVGVKAGRAAIFVGLFAHKTLLWGHPNAEERRVGKVVMYGSVSVDGFVADENDQPGPLFDWLSGGDVPLDGSGEVKVSQTSYDYIRPY